MLDIKHDAIKQRYLVEGIYYLTDSELELIKDNDDLIIELANNKKRFIEHTNELKSNTMIVPFFNDILLYSELNTNIDFCLYDYNSIIKTFKILGDNKVFTSKSKLMSYCKITWVYTEYSYYNRFRNDIVTTKNILSGIDENSIILEKSPMTIDEIKKIVYNKIDRIDLRIGVLGILEGLKIKELTSIKRVDLQGNNHAINVGDRIVTLSDDLYNLMQEYSNMNELERGFTFGTFIGVLRNTDYLFRPFINKRNEGVNSPMNVTHLTTNINQELDYYNLNTVDIRNYAIWTDIINEVPLEEINRKYGVKFRYASFGIRDKNAFNKLKSKIMG